jgi:hypothetical protein
MTMFDTRMKNLAMLPGNKKTPPCGSASPPIQIAEAAGNRTGRGVMPEPAAD